MSDADKITLTYDECDLDIEALREARRLAFQVLVSSGVNDLNTVTAEQWDKFCCVLKLAYENRVAARNHQYGLMQWRMVYTDPKTGEITEDLVTQSGGATQ